MPDDAIVPVGIDHIVLRVCSLDLMVAFYRDVLGCTLDRDRSDLGMMQMRAGSALIDLVDFSGPLGRDGGAAPLAGGRNLDHVCIALAAFDEERIRHHLDAHGVAIGAIAERYGAGGTGLSIYISDPEGNGIELKGATGAS